MTDIKVVGTPVQTAEQISINTPSVAVQRKLYKNTALKYLKEVGCFDWHLFGVITVVEYPDGRREIVDGGHRNFLAKHCFPDIETVPGVVLKVDNEQQAARLFHRFNGTASKNVNAEEKFIAQVFGEEDSAMYMAAFLDTCNFHVESNQQTAGSKRSDSKSVKISKFRDLANRYPNSTQIASHVIHSVFNDANVNTILFQGLVTLIEWCNSQPTVDWFKFEDDFIDFLTAKNTMVPQNKMTYPQMRKDNHYGISVAYGLYQDFYDWCNLNDVKRPFRLKLLKEEYDNAGSQD